MGYQRKGSECGSEKNMLEAKLAMRLSLAGMVLSAEGGEGPHTIGTGYLHI